MGIVLLLPAAYFYLKESGFSVRGLRVNAMALLLIPLGLCIYMFFCLLRFDDALIFIHAQGGWRQGNAWPWSTIIHFFQQAPRFRSFHNSWLDFLVAAVAILSLPLIFRRLGVALGLYSTLIVLLPLYGSFIAYQRYFLASFPHFLLLARWGRLETVDRFLTLLFIGGLTLYFTEFSQWGWIA